MSGFYGADVAEMRALAARFGSAADSLEAVMRHVGSIATASAWSGPDRDGFVSRWTDTDAAHMRAAAGALRDAMGRLSKNAAEQERTSGTDSSNGLGVDSSTSPKDPYDSPLARMEERRRLNGGIRGLETIGVLLQTLTEYGQDDIGIVTIVQPDGTRTHVVMIPGTQDLFNTHADTVFNSGAWVAAGTGHETELERRVLEAMREHGISADEPVQLVGHSLGGLVSGNIAAHAGGEFNVQSVVTIGSYVASDLPDGVRSLQVMDPGDPLTAAQGGSALLGWAGRADTVIQVENPDFSLVNEIAKAVDPFGLGNPVTSGLHAWGAVESSVAQHSMLQYGSNLLSLASGGDPTLAQWNQDNQAFSGGAGQLVEMSRYSIRDLD